MMLNGKLIIDELLIILFVFTLSLFPVEARTTSGNGQKVLVISSYSPIKEEGNHLIASFIDQMQVDSEAKIFVEYMDCEASPVFETWVGWMRQLFAAYKVKPDVVVLLGNEAWSSYRVTCVDSWHEIPVVLGYVKGAFIDYENKDKKLFSVADMMPMKESFGDFRITGYSYKDFVIENLSLIKQLQPHIRKVAFCYDNRYNMAFFESYINDLFEQIDSLDLRYMDGCKLSTPQLLDSIACMDDSYAILSAGWYTDALQYPHAHSMLHNELARYTSKPVYQVLDQGTSNMNYIGGYFISGEDLGKDLALLTHCVLTKGFENSPAFQFTPSLPNYYINYPTLVASGIDPSLLPENTVFYNEEPSLWQEHPVEVILFVCLVILMVVIFIGILNYRKRKEDAYKTANTKMMELLSRMPDMATIYDSDLNIVDIVNPDNHNWKDVDTRCQIGKNLKDLHLEYPQAKEMLDEIILHVKRTVETGEMKRRQELEENKLQLDFTLDAAQIISWEYNPDTRIFYSPRSTVFEGMTISLDEYLSFVDLEDRDLLRKGLEDLACGKIHVMEVQIRTMVPALGDRWFEMHAVPYGRNENGKIRKLIGLRRDITDLKMTNELIRLRNKAEEGNRLKSAFLANMSHEIRTPLNAIVGFSNLIAMAEEPDEIGEYVKIIETNNELLLQLVNDILDLSKIEAGQMDFNYSAVDLSEIFNNLQQVYKSRVKDGVDLVCHLPSVACVIHSEKNRLTQVLSNFLSNACKYTSEGSITMGYERIGAILRFYVADTGKGLAEENIPHVFERFAKFDSFVQGTGLGLSICESIIQSLDGKIGVDSELGKGSTFWFTIPYNPVNE